MKLVFPILLVALCASYRVVAGAGDFESLLREGENALVIHDYDAAMDKYRAGKELAQQRGDQSRVALFLARMARVHNWQGDLTGAFALATESLAVAEKIGDKHVAGEALRAQANVYRRRGEYVPAEAAIERSIDKLISGEDRLSLAQTFLEAGMIKASRNKPDDALRLLTKAEEILEELGDGHIDHIRAAVLLDIGVQRRKKGDHEGAAANFARARDLWEKTGDRQHALLALNNLQTEYLNAGRYREALPVLQEIASSARELGDRRMERTAHYNIGKAYRKQKEFSDALAHLRVALELDRKVDDLESLWRTFAEIGRVHQEQGSRDLAIVSLEEAVAVVERIRRGLVELTTTDRQAYAETAADTYRLLAELLLEEDRVLEAQRIIELLRVDELDEYLGKIRKRTELKAIRESDLTEEQKRLLRKVKETDLEAKARFEEFSDLPEVKAAQDRRAQSPQSVRLAQLIKLTEDLGRDWGLLYPLILDDRLELIVATRDSVPRRVTQPVSEKLLRRTILDFRHALATRSPQAEDFARALYAWLVKPVDHALTDAGIRTLVYIPDGALRYVPLAALHDDRDWLVRRFSVNQITALSLTDFSKRPPTHPKVLAGALTADETVEVRGHKFNAIPSARLEVEDLAALYPGTKMLLGSDFTPRELVSEVENYQIVHLATHGLLLPGRPADESFLLFAQRGLATLSEIKKTWLARDGVDLIVLSACQTGVGGELGNGEEVQGFGYLMQDAGANSVLASLWEVSDGGTQALMGAFYRHLKRGASKSEALRLAQLELIDGKRPGAGEASARGVTPLEKSDGRAAYAHPYYWAPFVLIGNGR